MSQSRGRRFAWWVLVILLTATALGAALLGGFEMVAKGRYLPPVADRVADRQAVMAAARTNVVKVLTYAADTIEQDTAAAEAGLTGDFLDYYKKFVNQVVIPTAKQKGLTTTATVVQAGVSALTAENASILLFVNQKTTSRDNSPPQDATSSVQVGMTRVNGAWLINSFNPV